MKVEGGRSKWFDVNVGVYQDLILSLFLFAIVLNEITKNVISGLLKNIFYADNLVLVGDSWEEVREK